MRDDEFRKRLRKAIKDAKDAKCRYCYGPVGSRNGKPNKSCASPECRGKAKAIGGIKAAKDNRCKIRGSKFL